MNQGLENYASPILRAAVFRRLNPEAHISYTIVPIAEAFPEGHRDYEGKATEAVRCDIVWPDGRYVSAYKEIDKVERGRQRPQTPEDLAKDETKALGRALRDCGIPQRLTELRMLMQWIAAMDGSPIPTKATAAATDVEHGEPDLDGSGDADDDAPDAGSEPTREQVAAEMFARLNGHGKAAVSKHAREQMGVANVMRAGDRAEDLISYMEKMEWLKTQGVERPDEPEEPF